MQQDQPGSSRVGSVTPLRGDPVPDVNEGCVRMLRALLERAESGEVVGVVYAALHSDKLASYGIGGMAGPYSMLGALDMASDELKDLMRGQFDA
tara:strand:+ start:411 stop:692 length:282 start_codon:yes stop_codon:yes gene_type:complete